MKETIDMKALPIDVGRLSSGLKTVFLGVSEVFASLGASDAVKTMTQAADSKKESGSTVSDQQNTAQRIEPFFNDGSGNNAEKVRQEPKEKMEKATDIVKEPLQENTQRTEKKPSVSVEDIINICTKKIEQDRNATPKIASILKSYGDISKLTDLPKDKYEDFLTRISNI